jgi:CHRD domain
VRKRVFLVALTVAVTGVMVSGNPALAGDPRLETTVKATLTGEAVVPGPGDPDGAGDITLHLYPVKNKICYNISASGIAPATEAHLHLGDVGEADSVRLNLKTPPEDGSSARKCRRGLSKEFIQKIKRNPSNYYVDVHNAEYSDGALRGQVF